jgi:hypothetical protein
MDRTCFSRPWRGHFSYTRKRPNKLLFGVPTVSSRLHTNSGQSSQGTFSWLQHTCIMILKNVPMHTSPTRTSYLCLQTPSGQNFGQKTDKVPEPTPTSLLEPLTLGCCTRISESSEAHPAADSPTPGWAAPSAGPTAPSAQTPPAAPAAPGASPCTPAATCHTEGTCGWCGGLLARCRRRWRGRASSCSGGAGRSEGSWKEETGVFTACCDASCMILWFSRCHVLHRGNMWYSSSAVQTLKQRASFCVGDKKMKGFLEKDRFQG